MDDIKKLKHQLEQLRQAYRRLPESQEKGKMFYKIMNLKSFIKKMASVKKKTMITVSLETKARLIEEHGLSENDFRSVNGVKEYWVEGITGGVLPVGMRPVSYDFQEALGLAIEQVLDSDAIMQLREKHSKEPCLLLVPAIHGPDVYKLTPISLDELNEIESHGQ